MNNRQAGAFRELVRKEERAREKWAEANLGIRPGAIPGPANGYPAGAYPYAYPYPPSATGFSNTAPAGSLSGYTGPPVDSLPPPPHSIYSAAIRVSSPRLVDEDAALTVPQSVQRRVVRQVEVPYTRKVKVPVKTRKIVPVAVQKKVKTKKLVEVPSWTTVDEEYTDVMEVPAVRQKEIWVKKLVPEKFMKKVEIKKNRKVKVPTTVLKEVDDYEVVEVTENRAVEVDGYRVDEVEDSKLVEVEEYQNYDLKPVINGQSEVINTREIGPVKGFHHSRRIGAEVYHPQDERHREIEEDTSPDDLQRSSLRNSTGATTLQNNQNHHGGTQANLTSRSTARTQRGNNSNNNNNPNNNNQTAGLSGSAPLSNSASITASEDFNSNFTAKIGFRVKNSHANGVIVYRVQQGEIAERAGLQVGDIIIYANNKPTRNLTEFRSVIHNTSGPVYLQVLRRGAKKLLITVHR